MKLANNFLSATALAATSEAVAFGIAHGLDMATMIEVLNVSTGRNSATTDKFPNRILTGSYDAGFSTAHMTKDVGLFVDRERDRSTRLTASRRPLPTRGAAAMPRCPAAISPRSGGTSPRPDRPLTGRPQSSCSCRKPITCGQTTAATASSSVPSALCGAMNA